MEEIEEIPEDIQRDHEKIKEMFQRIQEMKRQKVNPKKIDQMYDDSHQMLVRFYKKLFAYKKS